MSHTNPPSKITSELPSALHVYFDYSGSGNPNIKSTWGAHIAHSEVYISGKLEKHEASEMGAYQKTVIWLQSLGIHSAQLYNDFQGITGCLKEKLNLKYPIEYCPRENILHRIAHNLAQQEKNIKEIGETQTTEKSSTIHFKLEITSTPNSFKIRRKDKNIDTLLHKITSSMTLSIFIDRYIAIAFPGGLIPEEFKKQIIEKINTHVGTQRKLKKTHLMEIDVTYQEKPMTKNKNPQIQPISEQEEFDFLDKVAGYGSKQEEKYEKQEDNIIQKREEKAEKVKLQKPEETKEVRQKMQNSLNFSIRKESSIVIFAAEIREFTGRTPAEGNIIFSVTITRNPGIPTQKIIQQIGFILSKNNLPWLDDVQIAMITLNIVRLIDSEQDGYFSMTIY